MAGDITAVVTYDVSRLYMLEGLCLLWGGPLAAAVYVVTPAAPGPPCTWISCKQSGIAGGLHWSCEQVMLAKSGRGSWTSSTTLAPCSSCCRHAGCRWHSRG